MTEHETTRFDALDFIIRYETGDVDEDEIIEGFQQLVDSGLAWSLQGSYGRTAASLIEAGLVTA
jgi:hypothetical protein